MLTKRIIPCLDVTDGRVVKGTHFLELKDAGDPVELAAEYNRQGADELVFLDITASSDKRAILLNLVKKTAEEVLIPFTVGGGIRDIQTIHELLKAGADKVSINTAAVSSPELIKESAIHFGSQCIVAAVDVKRITNTPPFREWDISHLPTNLKLDKSSKWEIVTHGGRKPTGIDAVRWCQYLTELGAGELLLTSMDQDGTKTGYDIELTKVISNATTVPIIASGGAGKLSHIKDALDVCEAALLASLLHFKELTINEIKTYCMDFDIPIRK